MYRVEYAAAAIDLDVSKHIIHVCPSFLHIALECLGIFFSGDGKNLRKGNCSSLVGNTVAWMERQMFLIGMIPH